MTEKLDSVHNFSDLTVGMMERYAESGNVLNSLDWALPQILSQIHAQAGSLFLIQDNQQELLCSVCHGPVDITGVRVSISSGLVGQAFREQQGSLIEDAQANSAHHHAVDEKTGFITQSILTVPVVFGTKCFGCLQAINRVDEAGQICAFASGHLRIFEKLAAVLAVALQNVDLAGELVKDALIKKDLKSAEEVQSSLFPAFDKVDCIVGKVIPARNLSGDFLDFIQTKNGILFCQGDVAGKGIPAALTVARCLALFRFFGKKGWTPEAIAAELNAEIYDVSNRDQHAAGFVTFFVGLYVPETGEFKYVNCGHGDILLFDGSNSLHALGADLPPIGVVDSEHLNFELKTICAPGGRLFVFTDGVLEASANGKEIGLSGVKAFAKAVTALPIAEALNKIMALFDSRKLITSDDATLMIVGH
jgi:sigma-B regulation protein RsbU (phosphoserine phosphatase)